MGLLIPAVKFKLSREEFERFFALDVDDEKTGGPQDLYHRLEELLRASGGELELDDELLIKVNRYAYKYGGGGYQGAFRQVIAAARRAGWEEPTTPWRERQSDHKHRRWAGREQ